jgi:DNA invertase Pin-like site-specific DNA recombinase
LEKAIAMTKRNNATLVVSRQDRLARNVQFISNLLDSGVNFVAADHPNDTQREILLRANMDEEESDRISNRTKHSLQIAKEKGRKLGSARENHWKGREHLRGYKKASPAASKARHEKCLKTYEVVIDIIRQMKAEAKSLSAIADELNKLGHVMTTGGQFSPMAVCRILKMFKEVPATDTTVRPCPLTVSQTKMPSARLSQELSQSVVNGATCALAT